MPSSKLTATSLPFARQGYFAMSFVSGFEHDVFISYAHHDNNEEWVVGLKRAINSQFEKCGFKGVKLFLDSHGLRMNENWRTRLEDVITKSALHLVIVSPNYLKSKDCTWERKKFLDHFGIEAAVQRLFVVINQGRDSIDEWPEELRTVSFCDLTERDPSSDVECPLSLDFTDSHRIHPKIVRLTIEIGKGLGLKFPTSKVISAATPEMESRQSETASQQSAVHADGSPLVFLAEVVDELNQARDEFASYLEENGCRVFPGRQQFRGSFQRATQVIPDQLKQATLVIQLHSKMPIPCSGEFARGIEHWLLGQTGTTDLKLGYSWLQWRSKEVREEDIGDAIHHELLFGKKVKAMDFAIFKQMAMDRIREIVRAKQIPQDANNDKARVLVATKKNVGKLVSDLTDQINTWQQVPNVFPLKAEIIDNEAVTIREVANHSTRSSLALVGLLVVYADNDEVWAWKRMDQCRETLLASNQPKPVCAVYIDPPEETTKPKAKPWVFDDLLSDDRAQLHQLLRKMIETVETRS